jgi:hypothetical protein
MARVFTALGVQPGDVVVRRCQHASRPSCRWAFTRLRDAGARPADPSASCGSRSARAVPVCPRAGDVARLRLRRAVERVRAELARRHARVHQPRRGRRSVVGNGAAAGSDDGDAVRWIFYSSGTTADQRHATSTAAMASGRGWRSPGFRPDDAMASCPFTHIGGLTNLSAVLARVQRSCSGVRPGGRRRSSPGARSSVVAGRSTVYLEQQRLRRAYRSCRSRASWWAGALRCLPRCISRCDEMGGRGRAHGTG